MKSLLMYIGKFWLISNILLLVLIKSKYLSKYLSNLKFKNLSKYLLLVWTFLEDVILSCTFLSLLIYFERERERERLRIPSANSVVPHVGLTNCEIMTWAEPPRCPSYVFSNSEKNSLLFKNNLVNLLYFVNIQHL